MVHDREGMVVGSEAVAHIATSTKYQCINTKWNWATKSQGLPLHPPVTHFLQQSFACYRVYNTNSRGPRVVTPEPVWYILHSSHNVCINRSFLSSQ